MVRDIIQNGVYSLEKLRPLLSTVPKRVEATGSSRWPYNLFKSFKELSAKLVIAFWFSMPTAE
jgi:hypothetical protein